MHQIDESIDQKFPWRLALISYFAAFGLIATFSDSFFWDDWAVKTLSNQMERAYWKEHGFPPPIDFILIDIFQRNPTSLRLASFAAFFVSAWFLFYILKKINFLSHSERALITVFFLVLPINSARVALQMFNYTYSLFFFFAAWYLLITKQKYIWKILAVALFLLSFNTLSFIFFLVIPASHLFYLKSNELREIRFKTAFPALSLAILGPSYWIFIKSAYPPSDFYRNYYSPSLSGTARGLFFAMISLACLTLVYRRYKSSKNLSSVIFTLGLALISIGAFPYMTSGRLVDTTEWLLNFVPQASDWNSRNQLLLGVGFSFLLTGLIGMFKVEHQKIASRLLISICVILNFTFMQGYMLDALKQDRVIELFSDSELIQNSKVVMINDLSTRFNARGRSIRSYEWEGMLQRAFGDRSRKVQNFSYIDCNSTDTPHPDLLLTIDSTQGKLKTFFTNRIDIKLSAKIIEPCT